MAVLVYRVLSRRRDVQGSPLSIGAQSSCNRRPFSMQLHHVDLVPGESVRVGNLLVTLVEVQGSIVQLHVQDDDGSDDFSDPFDRSCLQPELVSVGD